MAERLTDGFVPNDVMLNVPPKDNNNNNGNNDRASTMLITGPNMGGKSTLLRQTALCVILAQLGSYVPGWHH